MNRKQKENVVASLVKEFSQCEGAFVITTTMNAQKTQHLKKKLHGVGATMKVVKNTLLRKAALQASVMEPLVSSFKNQVALVFAPANVPAVAAVVKAHGYGSDIRLQVGLMQGVAINSSKFEFIANLPSIEVLHARLCGVLQAPLV